MKIKLLDERAAIVRLPPEAPVPAWVGGAFASITRTEHELSIVAGEGQVPEDLHAERGWRVFEVSGPIDFSEVGVLASLASPLAAARVSIFAVSTFDTDYLMVKETSLDRAIEALRSAGHEIVDEGC